MTRVRLWLSREALERRQVVCYLVAVGLGLVVGTLWPRGGDALAVLVWPLLGLLLYATFVQVPMASIPAALRDVRFLVVALVGNFVVLPLVAWALVRVAVGDDALRLGLLLVLLVPCTDWFVTFSQLGRGDVARAIALTPLNLVVQLLALPVWLGLLAPGELAAAVTLADAWPALVVVAVPLVAALGSQAWLHRRPAGERVRERLAWWPVPLLSLVVLLVAASHAGTVRTAAALLPMVVAVAAAFLVGALVVAKLLALAVRLPAPQGRTLAFSLGTRNSFVVLPLALSLPVGWELAPVAIVTQSLVELLGMALALWLVPHVLFPDRPAVPRRTGLPRRGVSPPRA